MLVADYVADTLCTPKERLPSAVPKEEFGRMIFEKKSCMGDRTKVQKPLEKDDGNRSLWRMRSAAKRECEP